MGRFECLLHTVARDGRLDGTRLEGIEPTESSGADDGGREKSRKSETGNAR